MSRSQQVFHTWLGKERERLFYWLPVLLGAGMAGYYALRFEPSGWALPLIAFPSLLLWRQLRKNSTALGTVFLVLGMIVLGASYAQFRTHQSAKIMLGEPLSIRQVTAKVDAIEHIQHGTRLTLSRVSIEGHPKDRTPERIRVSLRAKTLPDIEIGQRVRVRAGLMPPSGPVMEGGFDFARYFYFRNIGAVGFAIAPIEIITPSDARGFFAFWKKARDHLTTKIHATLPSPHAAIAAGLITGDDAAIPEATYEELRAANLIHIIAISGAHMVVIAGIAFVVLRALCALIPRYGLHPDIKPIVAFITWIITSCYLCITGFELSAVRAYVMISLILWAVILRREPYAMRSIAVAALLMLLFDPSDVIEPGFQLSFAATFALIAAFEHVTRHSHQQTSAWVRWMKIGLYLLMTTVIAEAAVLPFVLFHFNNLAIYGVAANLIMTPVVTLILMPMVAIFFVLMPLGLENLALHIMGVGIEAMLQVAQIVSTLPYALIYIPSPSAAGIVLCSFGLAWLCIWQTRVRHAGVAMMLAGLTTIAQFSPPDLFISSRLQQIAYRYEEGYVMLKGANDGLFASLWANGVGQKQFKSYKEAGEIAAVHCSKEACVISNDGIKLHASFTIADIKRGCPQADIWMSGFYIYPNERKGCGNTMRYIDRSVFDAKGTAWAWFENGAFRIEYSADQQGLRPWSLGWNR